MENHLDGIRVLDLTAYLSGPFTSMNMAAMGAEVIKIEPLGGDSTRRLSGSGAGFFTMFNRNKQSICMPVITAIKFYNNI